MHFLLVKTVYSSDRSNSYTFIANILAYILPIASFCSLNPNTVVDCLQSWSICCYLKFFLFVVKEKRGRGVEATENGKLEGKIGEGMV